MSGGIRPGTFDLVTGASLLHHLMDPRDALRTAAEALRPGGHAIFVDPFDGAGVIRGMFQSILNADMGRNDRLSDASRTTMEALSLDYEARLAGSEPEHFTYLEDKWIFAPEQIVAWGREAGFGSVIVRGNQDHAGMYRDYALMQLRMALPEAAALPDWALQILESVDASLTPAVRRRMLLEGTIVMRK
jgi:SAM-dependent methyltransferase